MCLSTFFNFKFCQWSILATNFDENSLQFLWHLSTTDIFLLTTFLAQSNNKQNQSTFVKAMFGCSRLFTAGFEQCH